jgi:2-iminobutanoate/2-iminopropanoate deaminase
MRKEIITNRAPSASGMLSQAIISKDFIFVSGQIHITLDNKLVEGDIEKQTHLIMKNIGIILEEAGANLDNIVKTTIYVTDISLGSRINKVYTSYLNKPFPAREMVCVKELPLGARLEISAIAYI